MNIYQNNRIALGYTEIDFPLNDLSEYFHHLPVVELKQIHSNKILFSSEIRPGTSGDGIILDTIKRIALIKTADCVPLFFWNQDFSCAGIIHCGWKGLQKKIEKNLIDIIKERRITAEKFWFYLGPGIEKKCYPVGPELYESFYAHNYRKQVFSKKRRGGFFLDIKKAIFLSLIELGISSERIIDSNICTFCEENRFPSFRRDGKSKNRIYNFLLLK
ncbi:MAG: polyphenol oxidase family protein [Candidatus Aminicenantes bacterium]|nr:polyphenol oxidase family protein [Candidatus Aminicenantes bacterium]